MTGCLTGGPARVNYHLTFLDNERRVQDEWKANFENEHSAICWMWIVGGAWALKDNWSVMELSCRRCCPGRVAACPRVSSGNENCCIARIPARVLKPASKSERQQPRASPLILIVERDDVLARSHESMVLDAGFSVGASWSNYSSAGQWLSGHSPDAAIVDVTAQDKSCIDLAKNLSEREIPFLAVSGFAAGTPGVSRIFRSVPWLEKPVSSASLHLALRSIL
jgi:CheY-like chemotaxis protein